MVGSGDPLPLCGNVNSKYEVCSRDQAHYLKYTPLSCNRWLCSIDYKRLAKREAHKAEMRMRGVHDAYLKNGRDLGLPVHLILSPPKDQQEKFQDSDHYQKMKSRALDLAKKIGIVGGCIVTHNKRGSNAQIKAFRQGFIDLPDSYHFHIIGFMPNGHSLKSNEVHQATGWVYKRIDFRNAKFSTVYAIAKYELSHAAYSENTHILTWFGVCSYNAVKTEIKISYEQKTCKICGADIHRYWDGGQFIGEATIKTKNVVYTLHLTIVNRLTLRYNLPICPARYEDLQDLVRQGVT